MLPPKLTALTLRYAVTYLGAVALLTLVLWGLQVFAGIDLSLDSMGIVIAGVAATLVGQWYGQATGARMPDGLAWIATLLFTAATVVISAILLGATTLLLGVSLAEILAVDPAELLDHAYLFLGILVTLLFVQFLFTRLMFGMGVKQGIKARAMKAP